MERKQVENERLRLIVFKSALELGKMVDAKLLKMHGLDESEYTFMVPIKENFFSDGHLKVEIEDTVRGKDVFFLTDIGNYSIEYTMHGFTNHASPNDLMMQLKDGIGACNCHAEHINIIMPLLYAGRQHRRNTRENLACGANLRELDRISRIKSFITFDAHDQGVEHAVSNMEFDNFFATNNILENFINDMSLEDLERIVFVAPDNGATGRRNVILNSFNSKHIYKEAGSFYKERDYNILVNGKNPITSHEYCGHNDLSGKTAIVVDDMISSGGSMFDVIASLRERNIEKVYIVVTYALFTEGIERFQEYYEKGLLDGVYTTNLSYIPEDFQKIEWLHVCDCSSLIADVVFSIHNDLSISGILKDRSYPVRLLERKFARKN